MLIALLILLSLTGAPAPGDDALIVDVERQRLEWPPGLAVSASGLLRLEHIEGRMVVRLLPEAVVTVNGELVGAQSRAIAGDVVSVRSPDGELVLHVATNGGPGHAAEAFAVRDGDSVELGLERISGPGGPLGVKLKKLADAFTEPAPQVVLGVTTSLVGEALAAQLGLEPDSALLVVQVPDELPAARAGVRQHDVIVSIDGRSPLHQDSLREALRERQPGDVLVLGLRRGGEALELEVAVDARTADPIMQLVPSLAPDGAGGYLLDLAARLQSKESAATAERAVEAIQAELEGLLAHRSRAAEAQGGPAREDETRRLHEILVGLNATHTRLADARAALEVMAQGAVQRRAQVDEARAALERLAAAGALRDVSLEFVTDADEQKRAALLTSDAQHERALALERWLSQPSHPDLASVSSTPAGSAAGDAVAERLAGMEERLARIEEALERLLASVPN